MLPTEAHSDYLRVEDSDASATGHKGGQASRGLDWWRERAPHLVWLCGLLAPGIVAFGAVVATPVPQPFHVPNATKLLQGAASCTWSSGGDFYSYPFTAFWNASSGDYGWEVRIADRSKATSGTDGGRRLESSDAIGGLRFGGESDVYDVPYAPLDPAIEVGWAVWLVPPDARPDPRTAGEWTSHAFVGTRVSTASHTFCGCQTMRGDRSSFRLTEHGRAQMEIVSSKGDGTAGGAPWYLNLTRREINTEIRNSCRQLSRQTVCPTNNETAIAEWANHRDNGTYWVLPPWVELYSSLPQ